MCCFNQIVNDLNVKAVVSLNEDYELRHRANNQSVSCHRSSGCCDLFCTVSFLFYRIGKNLALTASSSRL